ncbi:uncharacterized protein AMSG_09899 [Thecamonas trahens ATCC 50062]|uniref:PARP catalytic domain-containing protein n=1 Tax=Thecamonas trahens ATCC 50062 TaxID=461836 RepID=A0A0L0DP99_THETB|nr:hypothetical protein AMSG_09899 [Thecamonas trahens ATCC 50062]KNC54124.1 hypothetical protein AMSG_09899 [Thecamonas trahens ATCC 50062]|eukprot:XP_013753946.1 hypothetical protein AMSG_09899 [Thecamonas trahens ATCC 50062]
MERVPDLLPAITAEPLAAELAIVFFHAAVSAPGRATLVASPFPAALLRTPLTARGGYARLPAAPVRGGAAPAGEPDWDLALRTLGKLPSMYAVAAATGAQALMRLSTAALRLLAFLLIGEPDAAPLRFALVRSWPAPSCAGVDGELAAALAELAPHAARELAAVVRVDHARAHGWDADCAAHGVSLAFHGSPLENFHSILRNGFDLAYARRDAFGAGLYFTSQLSVAAAFAPAFRGGAGRFRPTSHLPLPLRIVAVVHIVNHPSVECGAHKRSAAAALLSLTPQVPESYFIVRDTSLVRVVALLLFTAHPIPDHAAPLLAWRAADADAAAARQVVGPAAAAASQAALPVPAHPAAPAAAPSLGGAAIASRLLLGIVVAYTVWLVAMALLSSTVAGKRLRRALRKWT